MCSSDLKQGYNHVTLSTLIGIPAFYLITHNEQSLVNEMQRIYDTKIMKEMMKRPWEIPLQKPRSTVQGSIFGQKYLSITLDEVHNAHNHGSCYLAALRVFQQSVIKLALTATPLHTGHKVCVVYHVIWRMLRVITFRILP